MDEKSVGRAFDPEKVPDIKEIFDRFKLPNFDVEAYVATRQADIDAVTRATSIALAGAQGLAQKQADLLKSTLGEMGDAMRTLPEDAKNPGELMSKQRELVQSTLTKTLESMKEMAEAAQKSQAEIFEVASERVRTNVENVRELFKRESGT